MAAITPNFKLKNPVSESPTLIYLKLYYNKERFVYSTGLTIRPELWDQTNDCAYQKNTAPDGVVMTKVEISQAAIIDNELNRYRTETARIFNYFTYQAIQPTNELIKAEFDKVFKPDAPPKKAKEPEKINLNQYINRFISDIEQGKRTTSKGTRYTEGTIKNYKGFKVQFDQFQEEARKRLDFDHITIDFYDSYVAFFNKKNYSPNTIGRHIKALKVIIRAAKDEGLTNNQEIDRKKFKVITVEVKPVYLTEKELNSIYELDLSENKPLDIARDIFLIGCYTAQRFSDYSRINAQHIREIKGGKIIDLTQKKTGEQVLIPIRPELDALLKKYNYNLPRTYEQKTNERIKIICEKAKIKEMIEVEEVKGGLKVTQNKPKHELIKTHTARRTGATLMFLAGIETIKIMKITGHRTEREFLKYIRISKEENANSLINHPYFKGSKLKIAK